MGGFFILNIYFYVSHSMSLDYSREFGLSLEGLCSEVLLYYNKWRSAPKASLKSFLIPNLVLNQLC